MTGFQSRQTVVRLREQFKPGVTVELTAAIEDPYHPLPAGLRGECCGVDDAGQIMMIWKDGSTLSLISGEDRFHIVKHNNWISSHKRISAASRAMGITHQF